MAPFGSWRAGAESEDAEDAPRDNLVSAWCSDPDGRYEQRWRDEYGRPTGWVVRRFWDPLFDGQQGRSTVLAGYDGMVLHWREDQLTITGPAGVYLEVPADSCRSALVSEVHQPDRTVDLRLSLHVELGGTLVQPPDPPFASVVLFFPWDRRTAVYGLAEALRELPRREPVGAMPVHRGYQPAADPATDLASPGPFRDAGMPTEARPATSTARGWTADAAPSDLALPPRSAGHPAAASTLQNDLRETLASMGDRTLYPDEWTGPTAGHRVAPGADPAVGRSAAGDVPRDASWIGLDGPEPSRPELDIPGRAAPAAPAPLELPRLAFARVPDTDSWLTFRPLASSEEIRAPEPHGPAEPGHSAPP